MTKTKMLLDAAEDQIVVIKQIVMQLLNEPMNEDQKELVLRLYRMVK